MARTRTRRALAAGPSLVGSSTRAPSAQNVISKSATSAEKRRGKAHGCVHSVTDNSEFGNVSAWVKLVPSNF